MTEGIIVAVITGGLAILGNFISSGQSRKLILYRLDELEEKQDKHNGLIERMVKVEQSTKTMHRRLDGVEQKIEANGQRGAQ